MLQFVPYLLKVSDVLCHDMLTDWLILTVNDVHAQLYAAFLD